MNNGISRGEKNSINLDVYLSNEGSKNEFFNVCPITHGYAS